MTDHDKTKKIECIKRSKTIEQIAEEEKTKMEFFLRQAMISKQRLNELGIAA